MNKWLFEWRKNKVMRNTTLWRKLFIQSFETDFDYNCRWPKFEKSIGSDNDKVKSKKPLAKDAKRKKRGLPNANDVKGGIVETRKKRLIKKKLMNTRLERLMQKVFR